MFEAHGKIDITPSLLWSEVRTAGFMIEDARGVPTVPPGQWVELVADREIVNRPEGVLHRFTFAALTWYQPEVPLLARETMREQVAAIVAAFPANTFGTLNRRILFRGNELDDFWRIRIDPDRSVHRQVADIQWLEATV